MDEFQALTLIGLDGPDSTSPRSEIEAEITRLQAAPMPHNPLLTDRIESLQKLAETATEKGGFQPNP